MSKLPWINANLELPKTTQAAWSALEKSNSPPRLFLYHNVPCRLIGSSHAVRKLRSVKLRYELARCARWVKWVRGVKVPTSPPTFVCTDMLASPIADMPLPILKGIQVSPVGGEQRDDHKRGYDPESEIYYVEEVSP